MKKCLVWKVSGLWDVLEEYNLGCMQDAGHWRWNEINQGICRLLSEPVITEKTIYADTVAHFSLQENSRCMPHFHSSSC